MTLTPSSSAQCQTAPTHPSSPPSRKSSTFYEHITTSLCSASWITNAPRPLRNTSKKTKMKIQIVPPHNHRANAIERAIGTFKEHFVAVLATVDMLCPLQLWDNFLSQVELALNLLCFSQCKPNISDDHKLYAFTKMPLALLSTKALIYNDPATCASWAPQATDGFYVGPAIDHYRLLRFYIPATRRFCFSDTWRQYLSHCRVPI